MAVLTAAVVLLTVLVLFNLMLTFALTRRLRTVTGSGGRARSRAVFPDLDEVKAGRAVTPFTATTTTGESVSYEDRYGDQAVYAFLNTACDSCEKQLGALVDLVEREGLTRHQVIAFVMDESGEPEKYTKILEGHLTVVVHGRNEGERPFDPGGYPAFVLVDPSGHAVRSGVEVADLDSAFAPA